MGLQRVGHDLLTEQMTRLIELITISPALTQLYAKVWILHRVRVCCLLITWNGRGWPEHSSHENNQEVVCQQKTISKVQNVEFRA